MHCTTPILEEDRAVSGPLGEVPSPVEENLAEKQDVAGRMIVADLSTTVGCCSEKPEQQHQRMRQESDEYVNT